MTSALRFELKSKDLKFYRSMTRNLLLLIIGNVTIFLLLQFIALLAAFLLGYASNGNHLTEEKVLYFIFCLCHLLLNAYFSKRLDLMRSIFIGSAFVLVSWAIYGYYLWFMTF